MTAICIISSVLFKSAPTFLATHTRVNKSEIKFLIASVKLHVDVTPSLSLKINKWVLHSPATAWASVHFLCLLCDKETLYTAVLCTLYIVTIVENVAMICKLFIHFSYCFYGFKFYWNASFWKKNWRRGSKWITLLKLLRW